MKVYIGSDRLGFSLKNELISYMKKELFSIVDIGPFEYKSVEYPLIALEVSNNVREDNSSIGILVCGSGIGMSIAANKVSGIRAANCNNISLAEQSRSHNDANILCLGANFVSKKLGIQILETFIKTDFIQFKNQKRVDYINGL